MPRLTKVFNLFTKKLILLLALTLISYHSVAQRYKVTQYTEADGLGNSLTYDIAQDLTSKMWFATRNGITSYDGSIWKNYNTNDGLVKMSYVSIDVDEKGIIWALPYEGSLYLTTFNGDRWENVFPANSKKSLGAYRSLSVRYENNEPVVLIGTKSKGVLVNRHGKWTAYSKSNGLLSDIITATCFVQDSVFVATNKGINIISNNRISKLDDQKFGFPDNNIIGMCSQRITNDNQDKFVWVAGKDWLGYISDQEFILLSSNISTTIDKQYNSIYLSPDQDQGIYYFNEFAVKYFDFDTKEISSFGLRNGLISEGAISVFIDREKNAWIGGGRGVNKIPSKRFSNFFKENGLFDNEVTSVEEINPGNYIFGHIGALTFYENGVFTKLELASPSSNWLEKRVMDISIDNDRNIWVAAGLLGIGFIDINKKIKWFGEKEGLLGKTTSVISTSSGKIYASSNEGFFVFSGNRFELIRYEGLWDCQIRKIFETQDGSLYCTTYDKGVYKIKDGISVNIKYDGEKAFNSTFSVWESPEGDVLVGSVGGLLRVQDTVLVKHKDILLESPVYLIMNDHKGQLWLGSDNGIYRWDGNELKHFSVNDGLAGHEINRDAGLLDSNNNLWFGTSNGVSLYRNKYDYSDDSEIPPPNIMLSFVEVENDTLLLDENITLDYYKNDLTFNFKGISFIDETQIYYKCKLEGFEEDWSPEFRSLQNSYRYFNLEAGEYRFCVKVRNALGIWSDPLCSNLIVIKSPIWFQWWFISLAAIFILLFVGIISQIITQKKHAFKLEKTVQNRTKELNESNKRLKNAKEKAEESDRLKSAFLANMSHEIRTPMNGILGFTDLLKEPKLSGEEQGKYISVIESSGQRLLNTVNDLIDISKIEAGQMQVSVSDFNLNKLLEQLFTFFSVEAQKKGLQLLLTLTSLTKNIILQSDQEKIYSILTNLIKNAIKYTQSGSIDFGFEKKGNVLQFVVKDTGNGIPKERLGVIFDRFIRNDLQEDDISEGSGLGLSISKAYVEMLGGRIWVESKEGVGSQFYFTLPNNEVKSQISENIKLDSETKLVSQIKDLKILIAEDDVAADDLLSILVKGISKEVMHTKSGAKAVELCRKNPDIDLILMDINMPEMNGYEATKQIREFNKDVIIIAQTAYAWAGDSEKAIEAGCNEYISKPIKKEVLFELIDKHLNK